MDASATCRTCQRKGDHIRTPHYHPSPDTVEYFREGRKPLPRPSMWVPHAFREDLVALCNTGNVTGRQVLDLIERHGLMLARADDNR